MAFRLLGSRLAHASVRGSALAAAAYYAETQRTIATPQCASAWHKEEKAYHLHYFDARGVAETARVLMVLGGAAFTEDRWPLDFSKSRDEMAPGMAAARAKGLLQANLDRAPVLVVDGKHELGQSKSIERYLAPARGRQSRHRGAAAS